MKAPTTVRSLAEVASAVTAEFLAEVGYVLRKERIPDGMKVRIRWPEERGCRSGDGTGRVFLVEAGEVVSPARLPVPGSMPAMPETSTCGPALSPWL
jgi:hypothetical protein